MNKKLVAAALGLAFAAPVFADSSNVTLYGRVHQALNHNSTDTAGAETGGNFTIQDASSRLGVRGTEDLGGGLSAIFAYEFGVNTDEVTTGAAGQAGPMSTRHAYLGLKGSYGLFVIGSQDGGNDSQAPLYNQASLIGSVSNNGGPLTTVGSAVLGGAQAISRNQRLGNSIGYATTIAGVKINARHALTGTNDAGNNAGATIKENGTRQTEVTATYKVGALTVGGGFQALDQQATDPRFVAAANNVAGGSSAKNVVQAVASYNFGSFTLGGLVAQTKLYGNNPINNEDSNMEYAFSGTLPLSANSGIFGMYSDSERNNIASAAAGVVTNTAAAQGPSDLTQLQVAYYYDFSKRTRTYVGYNRLNTEITAGPGTGRETDVDNFTIGLRHNF